MSESISIELNVRDRGTAVVKKFASEAKALFERLSGQGVKSTQRARDELGRFVKQNKAAAESSRNFNAAIGGSILPLKSLAAAVAAVGLAKLIGETVSTAQQMSGLERAFKAAAGGAQEGAAEFAFIRQQSERLGLEMTGTADSYKGFLAATVAAGKESGEAREIFLGVAEASKALGLSNEQTEGTLIALSQIMSKGKVQAEELTGQLGERLPGAAAIMAEALNVSTAELFKMMEQGELTSDALVPFAQKLRELYGNDLAAAMNSSASAMNRLRNDATELMTRLGKGGLLDAVTLVANGLRNLFKEILASNAPEKLGKAFKELGIEFLKLATEYGPVVIKTMTSIVTFVSKNVKPVFQAAGATIKQVWAGVNVAFNQVVVIFSEGVKKISGLIATLTTDASDIAQRFGLDTLAAKFQAVSDEVKVFHEEAKQINVAAVEARDEWQAMLDGSIEKTQHATEQTRLTAAELRALGDDARVMAGVVVDAGKSITNSQEKVKAAIEKSAEESKKLGESYDLLKQKSGSELQAAARQSVEAFEMIKASGTETSERLSAIFEPVAKGVINAFGKVPPEMAQLFAEMRRITGQDFGEVASQGEDSAERITASFERAGQGISGSIRQAVDDSIIEFNRMERRTQELNATFGQTRDSLDDWVSAWQGQQVLTFGDSIEELQSQMQDLIHERSERVSNPRGSLGLGYTEFIWERYTEQIEEIQRRIDELRRQSDNQGSTGSGGIGTDGGTSGSAPRPSRGSRPTSSLGADGGSVLIGGSGGDRPRFGGRGGGGSSLVLGDEYRDLEQGAQVDDLLAQIGQGGGNGVQVDGVGAGTGARTIVIEGAQFNVNQTGIDPTAIDARGLARAMLPELQEAIRRGELETFST